MKKWCGVALATLLGLGTALAAPAADQAPQGGVAHTAKDRTKCFGPYSHAQACRLANELRQYGYNASVQHGHDGWYVCVCY